MPGVVRPYTLIDVLNTIYDTAVSASLTNSGSIQTISTTVNAVDQISSADTGGVYTQAATVGWDQQNWGSVQWH